MLEKQQNNETRRAMLDAIRERLAASAPFDIVRSQRHAHHVATSVDRADPIAHASVISLTERFRRALEGVSGHCVIVRDEAEAATAVQRVIEQRQARRIAISDSPLVRRVVPVVKYEADLLEGAAPQELFDCDLGVTGAQWAIAETGTLVLDSAKERHRLASLVPPVHVAIIEAGQIRQTMAEVLRSISESGPDG